MNYKPLPEELTIKESKINGLGLFAIKEIVTAKVLGTTHIKNKTFKDNVIRTPLGGFINHSDKPNSKLFETSNCFYLSTTEPIEIGDEITIRYDWYSVQEEE